MGREEPDPQDARTTRSTRRTTQPTDRLDDAGPAYGDPVNPDWRGSRATRRGRRSQGLPSSRQEFVLWLQYGGWRVLLAAGVLVLVLIGLIYLTRVPSNGTVNVLYRVGDDLVLRFPMQGDDPGTVWAELTAEAH